MLTACRRVALRNAIAPLGITVKDGSFHEFNDEAAAADGTAPAANDETPTKKRKGRGETAADDGHAKKAKKDAASGVIVKAEEDAEADD